MVFNLYFKIRNTTKSYDIPNDSQGETSQTEGQTLLYDTGLPVCIRRTKRKRRIRIPPTYPTDPTHPTDPTDPDDPANPTDTNDPTNLEELKTLEDPDNPVKCNN